MSSPVAIRAVALASLCPCLALVSAQDKKPEGRTSKPIMVKISDMKVKTDFEVKKGEWIEFTAEGQWRSYKGWAFTGLEGHTVYKKVNEHGRVAALVVQIGDGKPFGLGDGLPLQVPATGKLSVWPNRMWDNLPLEGEGELKVTVHVGDHLKKKRDDALEALRVETEALKKDEQVQKCLAAINEFRKTAGLEPVGLSTKLSVACRKHAKYLVVNRGHPLTAGLKAHEEHETLKEYSKEGERVAPSSAIHGVPPADAGPFRHTFYHRLPFLQPQLTEVGIGYYRDGDQWSTCVEVRSAAEGPVTKAVVYYPEDGQRQVPTDFHHEMPDPIPDTHTGKPAGFPVTVCFAKEQKVTKVEWKMSDDKKNEVVCHLSTPEKPARSDYSSHVQMNTVCAIPAAPLAKNTTYRCELKCTVDGKPFTRAWSFTTVKE